MIDASIRLSLYIVPLSSAKEGDFRSGGLDSLTQSPPRTRIHTYDNFRGVDVIRCPRIGKRRGDRAHTKLHLIIFFYILFVFAF